ncbi:MAG: protein kinase [Planctomycetota bacterium]
MTKKATASIDPICMELVRAGLLTYKQLNEVHRIVQETGGTVDDVLVSRGLVSKGELAKRRAPTRPKKKTLKIGYSMDLVKTGLLTFKQLNECHREARGSKGSKTVVDVMLEKGYVSDTQLATLPKPAERAKHKKFSSSWDLFRAGAVSLKALNDCHRHIKLEQPEKSLKEALIERGYLTREQLDELEKRRAAGGVAGEKGSVRSPFMEKYAKELEGIPADLQEELKKEHLASEGISPEEDARAAEKPAPRAAAPRAAAPAAPAEEFQDQKTFMDFSDDDAPAAAAVDDVDLQSAKTFMGGDEDEEGGEDTSAFQSEKTMMGGDDEPAEETAEEGGDFQGQKTMMDAGDDAGEQAGEPGDEDFRSQKTMMGADDEEGGADFRAAQTFMDAGAVAAPKETGSDPDIRGARTFMDAGEAAATGSNPDLRGARTFMDMGGEEAAPAAAAAAAKKAEAASGSTFMDMDLEVAGAGGMFGASETGSGIGPGMMASEKDAAKFQGSNTQVGDGKGPEREGATFMDLENQPKDATKSSALREAFDKAGKSGTSGSGTEFDAKTGKSSAGASGANISKTEMGGASSAANASKSGITSIAGKTSPTGQIKSGAGDSGTGSSTGTGSKTGTSGAGGSATEADSEEAKKARAKKKKDDEDAYKHPLVGKIIGGCRIVKKLGEGGMGAVFLAEHTKLKRQSVIKVVPAHLSQNRQLIARFEREARAAAIVQHPNIVAVYNVGEENGVHYIEMEYVDGVAIDTELKDKKVLEQMECVRIIKECCRGLGEAHKNGIIHRDIKPDNIMMTRKRVVKIADFGLARAGSEEMELTKVGQILGTPAYMSPEQCQGKPTDHRADIYSLGATFYAMITGKRPFTGASVMEIMQKHIDEEPISPREYNPEIAVQVVKIILRMMAKKPDDRFQSAEEVVQAIDQFMKEEGTEHLQEVQRTLGDEYKLVKKLGQGGMGAVYSAKAVKAKDRVKEGALVAIKVLNREVNPEEVKRFEQEAKLALEIDHENIIRVLEYKISDTVNYIVMEFVEGKSVRDVIRDQKKLDSKEAIRVVKEAVKGLGRAHQLSIIHRDIKPDNIMIAKTGAVKIADFGIAKHVEGQSELTQAGVVVGTPHYMSPEQCVGASRGIKITTQADIYSLGATLYFMVTGQKPFEGDTQMTIILQHLNQPPKPPKEVDDKIDESLSNVILNMMAKKPKYRYASVDDVVKDLEAIERGKKIKKKKHVDTSFEETGKGRLLLVGAAAAMMMFVTIVFAVTRGDPTARSQASIESAYKNADNNIKALQAKKQFAEALRLCAAIPTELDSLDITDNKSLAKGKKELVAALTAGVKSDQAKRDEEAKQLGAKIDSKLGETKKYADELRAKTKFEPDELSVASRCLSEAGDAYALAFDAAKVETFGDSPIVDRGKQILVDIPRDLNDIGRRRADAQHEYLQAKYANAAQRFYRAAITQMTSFGNQWESMKVPGRKDPIKLEQVLQKVAEYLDSYTKSDKEFSGPAGEVQELVQAAYANEEMLTKSGVPANSKKILTKFIEAQRKIPPQAANTHHARLLQEHVQKMAEGRERDARKLRDDAIATAHDLVSEGKAGIGKPHTAYEVLSKAKESIQELYDRDDADDKKTVAEYNAKLEDARAVVTRETAQKWAALKEKQDELAWGSLSSARGSTRRFLEAEKVWQSIIADAESVESIPTADGRNATLRQLAKDELGALQYNLDILRPYSDTNVRGMIEVSNGIFQFGDDRIPNQRPRQQASLPTFYIDRTEVTVEQYQHFLRTDRRSGRYIENRAENQKRELFLCGPHDPDPRFCFPGEPRTETGHAPAGVFEWEANKPIAFVSWYDAYAFANWAGKRLPKEPEWEKAATWNPTEGKKRIFPWGDAWNPALVVCSGPDDQWPDLPAVGSKDRGASFYGALDMAGSLWEWVDDDFAPYQGGRLEDDADFGRGLKAVRGGSYHDYRNNAFQGSYRDRGDPRERKQNTGFRCVRD